MPKLRFPDEIRDWVARRYQNQHENWLAGEGTWPLRVPLGCPTEEQALQFTTLLPGWVEAWRAWSQPAEVTWCERRWRSLGVQRLPEYLLVAGPEEAAILAGEEDRWTKAAAHHRNLSLRWPALAMPASRWFDILAGFDELDGAKLQAMLAWIEANPYSDLFARQLPIPGLDTKWLEPHLPFVADLVAVLRGLDRSNLSPHQCCGLKGPPFTVRFRILDPALRRRFGGLGDISAPLDEIRDIPLPARWVYIVENLQTGLAFEETPESVVVMALGYGVTMLGAIPWICNAECRYWGDLDTHGFAMLNLARSCLPHVESLLMDEATLLRNRNLWGTENTQYSAKDLPQLTEPEQAVYHGLKQQRWGLNVRLEQERIAWNDAWKILNSEHF